MSRPDRTKQKSYRKGKLPKVGDRDKLPRAKGSGARGPWLGDEAKKWYILIGLSVIISILLFPNVLTRQHVYKLGDVADRDIKASSDFLLEDQGSTEQNRQDAVKAVRSVYDFDPTSTGLVGRIREAFAGGREVLSVAASPPQLKDDSITEIEAASLIQPVDVEVLKKSFYETLEIQPDNRHFEKLVKGRFPIEVEEAIIDLVGPVTKRGVVGNKLMLMSQSGKGIILHDIQSEKELKVSDLERFFDLETAGKFIRDKSLDLRRTIVPKTLAETASGMAVALIKPNLTFNKRETELRKDQSRKAVRPVYFKVKKGEMIVREGERITPSHLLKLSEQKKMITHKVMFGRVPAMAILIGFLITAMYLVGLMTGPSSKEKEGAKDLLFNAVTLLVMFLVVIASNFIAEETARGFNYFTPRALLFIVPVASGAMLISIFQGIGVAATFSLLVAVLASLVVEGRVEFFIYYFISSLVAAHGVRNCRERSVFIKTGLKVSAFNMVLALSIETLYGSFYTMESVIALAAAFIGGILVGVIATGLLPLIEMSFGYTSDIKLLELANLDQPLLRELMVQAPGTQHHSVIVSNMVEATAKAINANPLLAKVAAYYHDIGKMKKPLYFVENQRDRENRHEKLAPSMSSLILISHVKDGVELAGKNKLGSEIIDIIRQHHGTSLISFFYEKAKEQGKKKGEKALKVTEQDFRYPGPKPQTKEAGLVMLADVVEAASRTVSDPTVARIQGMVQKMINKVFSDGQLDECELTLKNLHEIAKSFNQTLTGIFHHRIEYPESTAKGGSARKGENGNSDQLPEADARPEKPDDKAESGESLKRLGLS
jgi:cyclic-di-AMP phosphodiesterase PgpH